MPSRCTAEQVLAMRGWKDYLAALEDSPHREIARALGRDSAPNALATGAGLVRAIAQFRPTLLSHAPRIAVVATNLSGPEFMDGGRWVLSGLPLIYPEDYPEVALFLTHPEAEPQTPPIESGLQRLAAGIPRPRVIAGDVADGLAKFRPDLIALLYPACCDTLDQRMPEYRWLEPWVTRGTPIVGCYYDAFERSLGQGFFACAGIAHQRHADSPLRFALPHQVGPLMSWGGSLFCLTAPVEEHGHRFDELRNASQGMAAFLQRGEGGPVFGALLSGGRGAGQESVVTGFSPLAIGLRSGRIYDVACQRGAEVTVQLNPEEAPVDPADIVQLLPEPVGEIPEYRRAMIAEVLLRSEEGEDELEEDDEEDGSEEWVDHDQALAMLRDTLPQGIVDSEGFRAMAEMMSAPTGMMERLPLFVACDAEDVATIRALVSAGTNPNETDRAGWAPLAHCAADRRLIAMRTLLEVGADIDVRLALNGATPLTVALQRGNDDAVFLLLEAGADIDAGSFFGAPRDFLAAGRGGSKALAWFARHGKT